MLKDPQAPIQAQDIFAFTKTIQTYLETYCTNCWCIENKKQLNVFDYRQSTSKQKDLSVTPLLPQAF